MAYFKDKNGFIHFLSEIDISNGGESLLPPECLEPDGRISDDKALSILKYINTPTKEVLWAAYKNRALEQLKINDIVALRCIKAGVAYPSDWLDYDKKLRIIMSSQSGDISAPLPDPPDNRPEGA